MNLTCKYCGKTGSASLDKIYVQKNGYVKEIFLDHRGRRVGRSTCYSCQMDMIRKRRGTSPRIKCSYGRIARAVKTELAAARFFQKLGFAVEIGHGAGPDLFCDLGKMTWTVEVKEAIKQGTKKGGWRVREVRESRKKDDLIAIVMPNGRVYIDSMKSHLKECAAHGSRSITDLVKEFGLPK